MLQRTSRMLALTAVIVVVGFACSKKAKEEVTDKAKDAKVEYVAVGEYINPQDSLPRIRYFEGSQVSLNDRCAVRKVRLNDKMSPVYVNGQPVGFC